MITIGKKRVNLQRLSYMPPNLVYFDPETAENDWRVSAHSLNPKFSQWETLPALLHGCYITDSRHTLTRAM